MKGQGEEEGEERLEEGVTGKGTLKERVKRKHWKKRG